MSNIMLNKHNKPGASLRSAFEVLSWQQLLQLKKLEVEVLSWQQPLLLKEEVEVESLPWQHPLIPLEEGMSSPFFGGIVFDAMVVFKTKLFYQDFELRFDMKFKSQFKILIKQFCFENNHGMTPVDFLCLY